MQTTPEQSGNKKATGNPGENGHETAKKNTDIAKPRPVDTQDARKREKGDQHQVPLHERSGIQGIAMPAVPADPQFRKTGPKPGYERRNTSGGVQIRRKRSRTTDEEEMLTLPVHQGIVHKLRIAVHPGTHQFFEMRPEKTEGIKNQQFLIGEAVERKQGALQFIQTVADIFPAEEIGKIRGIRIQQGEPVPVEQPHHPCEHLRLETVKNGFENPALTEDPVNGFAGTGQRRTPGSTLPRGYVYQQLIEKTQPIHQFECRTAPGNQAGYVIIDFQVEDGIQGSRNNPDTQNGKTNIATHTSLQE